MSFLSCNENQVIGSRDDFLFFNGQAKLEINTTSIFQDFSGQMATGWRVEIGDNFKASRYGISVNEENTSNFNISTWNKLDVNLGIVRVAVNLAKVDVGSDL